MTKVRFSRLAREDLLQIWVAVARHDPSTADRVCDRIEESCRRLQAHPQLGPARPEIGAGARILIIERWLVLYRMVEDGLQVVRVLDGARDLTRLEWLVEE